MARQLRRILLRAPGLRVTESRLDRAHGDDLSVAQYAGHTAGLIAAACCILPLQRAALRPFVTPGRVRLLLSALAYIAAFWIGAETLRPPADWIFAFTVLGAASWIGAAMRVRSPWLWTLAATLAFSLGMLLIIPVGDLLIWARVLDLSSQSLGNHIVTWLVIGTPTGVLGGFLSSWPLARMLVSAAPSPEAQKGSTAAAKEAARPDVQA